MIVGGVCGVLGGVIGSPFFLVKTHLQAQAAKEIAFGHQHNHEGTWKAFKNIYREYGVSTMLIYNFVFLLFVNMFYSV